MNHCMLHFLDVSFHPEDYLCGKEGKSRFIICFQYVSVIAWKIKAASIITGMENKHAVFDWQPYLHCMLSS